METNNLSQVYNMLDKNSKDKVINNHENVLKVFKHDSHLINIVRTNEFTQMKEVYLKPVWRKQTDTNIQWTDIDEAQLLIYFGTNYGLVNKRQILEVLDSIFYQNSYNPITEYLDQLEWDGNPRLEKLFIDYLGAENNEYVREVTKISFLGCVLRAYQPGTKHDTVAVLVGEQGIGKSYLLSKMGMNWYNESLQSFHGDEAYIKISTSWIVELSELTALKRGDSESIKAFISAKEDIYRPKYNKYPIQSARKCVFFGTTNNVEFLKDETGNRRWLPIVLHKDRQTKNLFEDLTQDIVDQLWAETKHYYKMGDKNILLNEASKEIAKSLQDKHREDNGLKGKIEAFLNIPITNDWYDLSSYEKQIYFEHKQYLNENMLLEKREKICAWEIWHECLLNKQTMSKKNATALNQVLRQVKGLKETRTYFGELGQQRGFIISSNKF